MLEKNLHWQSKAPGSLMLFGEHAVLHARPAIACAIDSWLTINWQLREDDQIHIDSTLGKHITNWQTLATHIKLTFIMESLRQLKAMTKPPLMGLTLTISSDINSTQGLGSSSALVAAMVTGFSMINDELSTINARFELGLKIIRAVQGTGSGTDLAAALTGGVMMLEPKNKRITRLNDTLPIISIYCGYKTLTPIVIAKVNAMWSNSQPLFLHWLDCTTTITEMAAHYIRDNNLVEIGRCMNMAHGLMNGLGVSDNQLESIANQLRQTNGIYGAKISGSGLGDCVIALGLPTIALDSALAIQTTAQGAKMMYNFH
jgi:mevalonate kinase